MEPARHARRVVYMAQHLLARPGEKMLQMSQRQVLLTVCVFFGDGLRELPNS